MPSVPIGRRAGAGGGKTHQLYGSSGSPPGTGRTPAISQLRCPGVSRRHRLQMNEVASGMREIASLQPAVPPRSRLFGGGRRPHRSSRSLRDCAGQDATVRRRRLRSKLAELAAAGAPTRGDGDGRKRLAARPRAGAIHRPFPAERNRWPCSGRSDRGRLREARRAHGPPKAPAQGHREPGRSGDVRPAREARAADIDRRRQRRQLTVMFCDLVGSTAMSARLDPEDMRGIIAAYHRCCAKLITGSGGFVAKYMGDGVLAYFGYPQAHEHDAERAVLAGLAIVEAAPKLETLAGPPLHVRVGIATGIVVVGDLLVGRGAGTRRRRRHAESGRSVAEHRGAGQRRHCRRHAQAARRPVRTARPWPQDLKGVSGPTHAYVALSRVRARAGSRPFTPTG